MTNKFLEKLKLERKIELVESSEAISKSLKPIVIWTINQTQNLLNKISLTRTMRITKITIIQDNTRPKNNINDLLLLFGETLGLFSVRDKDKSCYRIFIVLIKALKQNTELTSDELARQTELTRGTVVHHLNRLMAAGIITNYKNKYFINYDSLEDLVKDMRAKVNEMLNNLEETAKKIDLTLDLQSK